jgi:hypothetical protein
VTQTGRPWRALWLACSFGLAARDWLRPRLIVGEIIRQVVERQIVVFHVIDRAGSIFGRARSGCFASGRWAGTLFPAAATSTTTAAAARPIPLCVLRRPRWAGRKRRRLIDLGRLDLFQIVVCIRLIVVVRRRLLHMRCRP